MHKYVKMFCNTNQFPSLTFCGLHTKTHSVRGLSKHYNMIFDPKLVHDTCKIRQIPRDCVERTSILDRTWVHGLLFKKTALTNCNRMKILTSARLIKQLECYNIIS